jgi:Pentapeptide repeats (9 copies)
MTAPAPTAPPPWPYCGHGADSATDPVGCRGAHLPGRTTCLAHAGPQDRTAYLAGLPPGSDIDHRGTTFTEQLLNDLLEALQDPQTGRPTIGTALFCSATFTGGAWFASATFTGRARFDSATFNAAAAFSFAAFDSTAEFRSVTFEGSAGFRRTTFTGDARFDSATFHDDAWFDWGGFHDDALFRSATFHSTAAFGSVTFSGSARFDSATFTGSAGFRRATFTGDARFDSAGFHDDAQLDSATFHGDARFDSATFDGDAGFDSATFKGNAGFRRTTFTRTTGFGAATFDDDAWFVSATFNDMAGFVSATFRGTAWFVSATFDDDAWFGSATFHGDARFDLTTFNGKARFGAATFHDSARFRGVRFVDATSWGPVRCWAELDLSRSGFEQPVTIEAAATRVLCHRTRWENTATLRLRHATVDLADAVPTQPLAITAHPTPFTDDQGAELDETIMGQDPAVRVASVRGVDAAHLVLTDVNLSECRFTGAFHLDQIRIEGTCAFAATPPRWRWHRGRPVRWTRRRALAEEHHWRALPTSPVGHPYWRAGQYPDAAHVPGTDDLAAVYRQLRKAFEDAKNEPDAADFYYGEMEMRRHDRGRPPTERALLTLYWAASGYGLRASRALAWLLAAMALTVGAMLAIGLPAHDPQPHTTGTLTGGRTISVTTGTPDPDHPTGPLSDRFTVHRAAKASEVVVNSVVFRSSGQNLTTIGTWIEMLSRLTEPTFLALAALAIRNRVKR